MAQKKATKKYEREHLKDDIKRRKDFAKIKQRHVVNAKKKARRATDRQDENGDAPPAIATKAALAKTAKKDLESMDVDEFFQSGLDVAIDSDTAKSKGKKRKRAAEAENGDVQSSASDSESEAEDLEEHKKQMKELAEKDPEFHKYLQENDPDLLDLERADFNELAEGALSDDDEPRSKKAKRDSDDEDEQDEDDVVAKDNEVTPALLTKWANAMAEQHSLRASREVVVAFRAAVHTSDDDDNKFKYSVSNPEAYHQLLVLALTQIPEVLQHHLPAKETASGKIRLATESKKFSTLSPMIKTFLPSVIHLLGYLSDPSTLKMTLSSTEALLPYALSFKKLIRDLVKAVVSIWSTSSYSDTTRIAAFLVLRKIMVIGDASIREAVLKSAYQGLVKGAKNTTVHTLEGINLMKNAAAELWGLDASIGYTSGFSFIRQLAIHLRSSIANRAKESYKLVYNWQYVHSLDFWSRVLSTHCDSRTEATKGGASPLRPLIYPLVQVTLGALRLLPTAAYFPLRFFLTRALLRISASTGTYIPLAASLHEVLSSGEMRKPPKGSSLKALDFAVNIRAPKAYLGTRVYQDGLGEQVVELLGEFFLLWAKGVAFPELALPAVIMLKRWLKDVGPHSKRPSQNPKVSGMVGLLVQKLSANCKWIEERRAKVEFAPRDRSGVDAFLKDVGWEKTPLGAFMVGQRRLREERNKMVESARRDEERRKAADKKKGKEVVVAEEEDDSEVDEDEDEEADGDAALEDFDLDE